MSYSIRLEAKPTKQMPIKDKGAIRVVDRGKGDQIFINTTGLGVIPSSADIGPHRITPGDRLIVSGDLGRHGMAVLSVREGLTFSGDIASDSAPLHDLVMEMIKRGLSIHCLRDLTRGGLASALNELAITAQVRMTIDESRVPVSESVRGACEILGLDPLYVANEGRCVLVLPLADVEKALSILQSHAISALAAEIGEVHSLSSTHTPQVILHTPYGTHRILELLSGEQLPRIC